METQSGTPTLPSTTDPGTSSLDGPVVANWIFNVFGVPMYVIGMSGNILTLVVLLSSRSFRATAFGMLLMFLSVSDMGVLNTGHIRHCILGLTWDRVWIRDLCQWCCKIQTYLTYVFVQLSPWTLCLVTLERALAVTCPMKTAYLCTKRRMFGAWLAVFVIVTSLNLVLIKKMDIVSDQVIVDLNMTTQSPRTGEFVTTGINDNDTVQVPDPYCKFVSGDFFMSRVMPIIYSLLAFIIPGVVMLTLNIILYRGIRQALKTRASIRSGHENDNNASNRLNSDTRMLVGISVLFILTNLPVSVHYVYFHYWVGDGDLKRAIYSVVLIISYINNAFNFVIYCFRGRKFRAALRDLVSCNRKRIEHQNSCDSQGRATCRCTELTAIIT